MSRKINIVTGGDVPEERCYCCGKRAVVAVRGDENEPGSGFCLCLECLGSFSTRILNASKSLRRSDVFENAEDPGWIREWLNVLNRFPDRFPGRPSNSSGGVSSDEIDSILDGLGDL